MSFKHIHRMNNHQSSAISNWKSLKTQQQVLQIGNLVHLYCDRDYEFTTQLIKFNSGVL